MTTKYGFTYDYSKCMMMKMALAEPDRKGGSIVHTTIDEAIDLIKKVDNMTLGITKIIYLVGWQYNGHDDKYPDFFEANNALKRQCDKTALDSLLWLISEAKKYNTIISVHINWCDAYENAPSFNDFVENNALIRSKNGKPKPIQKYNGLKCYKTSLKEYWDSGLFKRQFDRLLKVLPLAEQGTIHVDNLQCYTNYSPSVSIKEMQEYRKKMILYAREFGIDVTSEFTLREHNTLKNVPIFGLPREHNPKYPIDVIGLVPAVWWLTTMNTEDYINYQSGLYAGGIIRKGNKGKYLYGNMHGEDIFLKSKDKDYNWEKQFLHEFATLQLPYNFLSHFDRLSIEGKKGNELCRYENDVISYEKEQIITCKGIKIKHKHSVCIPLQYMTGNYFTYSKNAGTLEWTINNGETCDIDIFKISSTGKTFVKSITVVNGKLKMDYKDNQSFLLVIK